MKRKILNLFTVLIVTVFGFVPFINVHAEDTDYTVLAFGTSEGGSYSAGLETNTTTSMNMTYGIGETITIKATPNEGYTFVGWYKGIIGDSHFVESYDSNTLISENADYSFTVTNETLSTFYAVFKEKNSPKVTYIDNTVDNSRSYVTGTISLKDLKTGKVTTETLYSKDFKVNYSDTKTSEVQNAIDEAYDILENKTSAYSNVHISIEEVTGKVWDNRVYTNAVTGDAILIGDADYLSGAYGVNGEYTQTFIASGDYGKNTYYRVVATAEYTSDEEYTILNGANGEYVIGSNEGLTVRANGNIDNFIELKIDGKVLDKAYYTVKSGSTIATISSSYLNTLSTGAHTLTFVYTDGEVSTNFTINKASVTTSNPQTSDGIINEIILFIVSLVGIVGTGVFLKRKEVNN